MTGQVFANGVILAENDPQMREIIRSLLLHLKLQVFLAPDGAEAVRLAHQFKVRLVLLDIAMPRLNGLKACEVIHNLPGYSGVPIVMLTAHDDARFRLAAKRVGATDFVSKPFRPSVLLELLAGYMGLPPVTPPSDSTVDPTAPHEITP